MKCKKLFALLLSLCMIASSFVAVSVAAVSENVIDINLPLDDASELTWVQPGVTVSNADGIGGRDNVVKAEGLANSNNNTVGVVLADNFKFQAGDVLTYSVDVYTEGTLNPDMWLRNHGNSLEPFTTFYSEAVTAGTWTTLRKTVAFESFGGTGDWSTVGKFALYLRPRQNVTVYFDNFTVKVARPSEGVQTTGKVVDIDLPLDDASEMTWVQPGVTVSNADGIGGRDNVIKAEGLSDSNNNTVGVMLAQNFAFQAGDILKYSVDVYSETAINPDMWLRNHGNSLEPFTTLYEQTMPTGTWTTVTREVAFENFGGTGDWSTTGNFAFYMRPRGSATVYFDNFKVSVTRVDAEDVDPTPTPDAPVDPTPTPDAPVDPTPTPDAPVDPTPTPDANRGNVISINETYDAESDLVFKGSNVALTYGQTIGGRSNVVKADNVADSNAGFIGVKLPDGFAFEADDILTYSVDVYSETEGYKPDVFVRDHSDWNPMATLFGQATAANEWITVTKTLTMAELDAIVPTVNSNGTFVSAGNYGVYVRPRDCSTLYLDNFVVTVSRVGYEDPDTPVDPTPTPDVPVDPTPTPDANRGNVISINETYEAASSNVFKGDAVTLTYGQTIGGRDNVVKAENVSNSNSGFIGVKLPDGFAFEADDILTYSVEVYCETDNYKPDIYVRDHSDFNPMAVLFGQPTAANTWVTVTKTLTMAELDAIVPTANSNGTFVSAGNYGVYVRPRDCSTLYLDNFVVTVSRVGYEEPDTPVEPTPPPVQEEKLTILEIDAPLDSASELTWIATDAVTVSDVSGIGGRDNIVKVENLKNSNNNSAGIRLPEGFAFQEGDVITISVDLYTEVGGVKSDLWLRNHDGDNLNPFVTFYASENMTTNEWVTVSRTVTYEEMAALHAASNSTGSFTTAGKYSVYIRPRSDVSVMYFDNFYIKVEGYERSEVVSLESFEVVSSTIDSATIEATFSGNIVASALKDICSIKGKEDDQNITFNVVRDADNKKKATITISGLTSSTEYELAFRELVLPAATIPFKTADEAKIMVVDDYSDNNLSFSIVNNTAETKTIHAVLLRCKGNTVLETEVVTYENCASGASVGSTGVSAGQLGAGEFIKLFAWTVDGGNVNSLAPSQIFE